MENFEIVLRRRFFQKIAPSQTRPGCIEWQAARRPAGYGLMTVDGVLRCATHVSWFLKHGVWPTLDMLHRCDNPPCVNPEHLFEGTDLDNAADRVARGRSNTLTGFDVGTAKLTGLEVSELVALTETRMTNAEIGALYGVGAAYVSQLRHGHSRGVGSPRPAKPKGCKRLVVGGEMLTLDEIADRAGVSRAAIEARIQKGLAGDDLVASKHKAPRKTYIRRK